MDTPGIEPDEYARAEETALALIRRWVSARPGCLPTCLELEDLLQEARIGVWIAAQRFDPSRGVRFCTYGVHWGYGVARRAIRQARWTSWQQLQRTLRAGEELPPVECEPISFEVRVKDEDLTLGNSLVSVERGYEEAEVWDTVRRIAPDQADILERIYRKGHLANEIAVELGVTPQAVSARCKKGHRRLRLRYPG